MDYMLKVKNNATGKSHFMPFYKGTRGQAFEFRFTYNESLKSQFGPNAFTVSFFEATKTTMVDQPEAVRYLDDIPF